MQKSENFSYCVIFLQQGLHTIAAPVLCNVQQLT
jgi:hypothetical protein